MGPRLARSRSCLTLTFCSSALVDFTAPICDLFVEVFELKENNWLRRQAIVIILQQILGGAIER